MGVLEAYDSLLLDLDGTVWNGGEPIEGAVDFINSCGIARGYVTNNASRSAGAVADKLNRAGITAQPAEVTTSAQAIIDKAREVLRGGSRVLVLGSESFRGLVEDSGYDVVDSAADKPAAVFQGFDPSVGWPELSEAAYAVRAGAKYFASNLDASLPTDRGFAVGNGALVAAVVHSTGAKVVSAGKPEPDMFLSAADSLGSARPLTVGDRLDTDIQGGQAAAMDSAVVLTGVTGPMQLIEAPAHQRPTYICSTLRDLAENRELLRPGAQGGFTARVDGADVLLDNGDHHATPVQALRTVLEVVWAMPEPPRYIHPRSEIAEHAVEEWW